MTECPCTIVPCCVTKCVCAVLTLPCVGTCFCLSPLSLPQVFDELRSHMFGNPHSANPSSSMTGEKVEEVRDLVLRYFNADPAEYQVVFTRSATGALKLVGETFPWGR